MPLLSSPKFWLKDAAASSSNFGSLQDGGSNPAAATTATGWVLATTVLPYCLMDYADVAEFGFSGSALPSANPDNTNGDGWRSESAITRSWEAGDWEFAIALISDTLAKAATVDGRLRIRLWRSSNADMSSPTQITSGTTQLSIVTNLDDTTPQISSGSVTLGAVTLTNEYLFLQVAFECTGDAAKSQSVIIRVGPGSYILPPDEVTPVTYTRDLTGDTVAASDSLTRTATYSRSIADTVLVSDSVVRGVSSRRNLTDTVVVSDSITKGATYSRSLSDTVVVSDSIAVRSDRALFAWTDLLFTRSTVATYQTDADSIADAAIDELRYEDRGDGYGPLALFEGERTNEIPRSESMHSSTYYVLDECTGAANVVGPDGVTNSASHLTSTGVGSFTRAYIGALSGFTGPVTWSVWQRDVNQNTGNHAHSIGVSEASYYVEEEARSVTWTRADGTYTSAGSGRYPVIHVNHNGVSGTAAPVNDDLACFGFQMENAAFPSSYIRSTAGSATTRSPDTGTLAAGSVPTTLKSGFWEVAVFPYYGSADLVSGNIFAIVSFDDANNCLRIRHDGTGVRIEAYQASTVRAASNYLTLSRHQRLFVSIDAVAGTITVAGATTGDGTGAAGTPWAWTCSTAMRWGGVYGVASEAFARFAIPTQPTPVGSTYDRDLTGDTAVVSDALSRTVTYGRAASDTAVVSDSLARTVTYSRTVSDTTDVTDSLSRATVSVRPLSDSAVVSDSLARTVTYSRTVSDTADVSDSLATASSYARSISDTAVVSDSTFVTVYRSPSDSVSVTDSLTPSSSYVRSISDTVTVTDQTSLTVYRAPSDTVTVTDSLSRSSSYGRTLSDSSLVTDAIATALVYARTLTDTCSVTDVISPEGGRAIPDAVSVLDELRAATSYHRILSDTCTVTDAAHWSFETAKSDSVVVSDSLTRTTTYSRVLSDAVVLTDSCSWSAEKTLADSVVVSDTTARTATYARSAADAVDVTDALTPQLISPIGTINLSDTVAVTDSLVRSVTFGRAANDAIAVTDSLARTATYSRAATDATVVTDQLEPEAGRSIADVVSVTDLLVRSQVAVRSTSDTTAVTDLLARAATFSRSASDPVTIADSLSVTVARSLSDSVTVTDSVARSATYARAVTDAAVVSDSLARTTTFARDLADAVYVTDQIDQQSESLLADTVSVTDLLRAATSYSRSISDQVEVVDVLVRAQAATLDLADTIAVTDSIAVVTDHGGARSHITLTAQVTASLVLQAQVAADLGVLHAGVASAIEVVATTAATMTLVAEPAASITLKVT